MGDDGAAEAEQEAGDDGADAAGSDHTGGSAVQPVAEQPVEGEVAVADAQVGAVDVAVEGEDQRQRVFGDRRRRVRRHAHDGDVCGRGGGEIDVVVTGAAQRDRPHAGIGEVRHSVGANVVVDEHADGGEPGGQPGGARVEPGLEVLELVAVAAVALGEGQPVVALGVVHQRAHACALRVAIRSAGRATRGSCRVAAAGAGQTSHPAARRAPSCSAGPCPRASVRSAGRSRHR